MNWKKGKRSLLGFWVLLVIVLFKILLPFFAYYRLKQLAYSSPGTILMNVFSGYNLIIFFILAMEIASYWWLRYKIRNKWWVRLHVWLLFIVMLLLPLLAMTALIVSVNYFGANKYYFFAAYLRDMRFYLFWGLVPLAHIFFIATIVKSFRPKKEIKNDDNPPGLLDEFID